MLILAKLKGYLIAIGVFAVAVLGVFLKGKQAARDEIQAKETQETLKTVKRADEIRDTVKSASDTDIDNELSEFTRKK